MSRLEQEMIINELLLDIFGHSSERVVDALVIIRHVLLWLAKLFFQEFPK